MVSGQAIPNDDPKLVITLDPSTGVGISDKTADTITYRFVEDVTEQKVHNFSLTFLYNEIHKLVVPMTLTQSAVTRPVIIDKPLDVTIFEEGTGYPFDVTYNDVSILDTIKDVVITADDNIHTSGENNWWIYDGPVAGGVLTVNYAFKVVAGGKDVALTHTGKFNLAAWDGKYLKLEGAPVGIFTANGNPYTYTYSATFHGKPYSDKVRLLAMDWPTVVSETTEGNANTVTISSATGNWTRVDFIYDRTDSATIVENVDRVTINTEVRIQTDVGLRLTRVGDIQHISGWLGDQLTLENYFLLENGNTVPWTDPRIEGAIIEGSSTKPNRKPQAKIIGYDVKGPIIEFTGPDWDVESNNYMKFWMKDAPETTTDVSEFYITPKVVKLSMVGTPATITGKLGQRKTVAVTVKAADVVIPNNTEGLVFAPADHLKFISATETTVTYEITFDNATAYNASMSPVVTVSLPKHLSTTYAQAITVTPTRLVTITNSHPQLGDIARPQQNDYLALRFNLSDGNGKTYGVDHPDVTVTPVGDHAINKGVVLTETVYEGLVVRTNALYVNLAPQYKVTIAGVPGSNTVTFYFDVVAFVAPRPSNGGFTGWNAPMLPNTVFDPLYFTTTPDTPNNPNRPNVYGFKLANPANSNAMLKPHGRPMWRNNRNEIDNFETGWTGGYVTGSGWLMYERWGRLTKINAAGFTVPKVPIVIDESSETVEANGAVQTCHAIISQIRTGNAKVNPGGNITALTIDGVATTLDALPLTVTDGRFEFKLQPSSLPKVYKVVFTYTDEVGMTYPGLTVNVQSTKEYTITTEPAPLSVKMWDKNTTYPFKVLNNGVDASAEVIITGITSNGVVNAVNGGVDGWSIESDVATAAQDVLVDYTFRMVGDPTETVRNASGTFKVAEYDGVEFRLQMNGMPDDPAVFLLAGNQNKVNYGVAGRYRGAFVSLTFVSQGVGNSFINNKNLVSQGNVLSFEVYAPGATIPVVSSIRVTARRTGTTGNTNKELLDFTFPAIIYNTNNQAYQVVKQEPTLITGKFGDVITLKLKLSDQGAYVDFKTQNITLVAENPSVVDNVELAPGAFGTDTFNVRFKQSTHLETPESVVLVTVKHPTNSAKIRTVAYNVKQIPDIQALTLNDNFETTGEGITSVILKQSAINPE